MIFLFLAVLLVVMGAFAGFHFVVGLVVLGAGVGLSALTASLVFRIFGYPGQTTGL
jgi:hypothetical protein